ASVERTIRATRYQPAGTRSYGQQRKGMKFEPADVSEVRPAVWAMIETRAGLDNLDAIAAVTGLTGLLIGPSDLSLALGNGPGNGASDPRWHAAIARIRETAATHRIQSCMVAN